MFADFYVRVNLPDREENTRRENVPLRRLILPLGFRRHHVDAVRVLSENDGVLGIHDVTRSTAEAFRVHPRSATVAADVRYSASIVTVAAPAASGCGGDVEDWP
ncbi:hypothetical protein MRX96_051341 [Rhipicephalus microplus]